MPFTVAPASGVHPSDCSAERILRVGPSLTPPTRSPQVVEGAFTGLASTRVRSPAIPGIRGTSAFVTDGVDPFGSLVPGTDDPSAPVGSTVVARLRELIALLVPTPDAAPLRLLRPRARGPMCRELHERFMPYGTEARNKKIRRSITFLPRFSPQGYPQDARCFCARKSRRGLFCGPRSLGKIRPRPRLWKTISIEHG